MLTFRTLSTFTAALSVALALVWGLAPEWLLSIWQVEYSTATGLVARRNAMLFLALGVMLYMARQAPPCATRRALCNGMATGVFGLAVLGVGEWLSGNAGPGIFLAVITEVALGLAFIQTKRPSVELAETTA